MRRSLVIRNILLTGAGFSSLAVLLTFYIVTAAVVFFGFGSYLVNALFGLPREWTGMGLGLYTVVMVLVIILQILQIIRRDREEQIRRGLELDLHNIELRLNSGARRIQ